MTHRRGRIYWITWALLVLGAAATGIASVQDAFFRGAVAAFLAPLALPLYERVGPRAAAFLGLATGIVWQLFLTHVWGELVWSETLRAYALSRFELDLSVSAAAFAGAALTAALAHRDPRFGRALAVGTALSLAMTALPYGFIRSSEAARLGPVEVTWFAPAAVLEENGRPWRPKGATPPALSTDDITCLRQAFLTVEVDGETAIIDTQGRRLWAVWRKRLTQPGHENGPVRRVFIASRGSICVPFMLALPDNPDEACALELTEKEGFKVVAGQAKVADAGWILTFEYGGAFERFVDTHLVRNKEWLSELHARAFLLLSTKESLSVPVLWCLRRTAMETPGEAELKPVETSDSFRGFPLIMPEPKPAADAKSTSETNGVHTTRQPVER